MRFCFIQRGQFFNVKAALLVPFLSQSLNLFDRLASNFSFCQTSPRRTTKISSKGRFVLQSKTRKCQSVISWRTFRFTTVKTSPSWTTAATATPGRRARRRRRDSAPQSTSPQSITLQNRFVHQLANRKTLKVPLLKQTAIIQCF